MTNETILLDVLVEDDKLVLRIDQDGLAVLGPNAQAIYELVFINWQTNENILADLKANVSETFEYTTIQENNYTLAVIYLNYESSRLEIKCDEVIKVEKDYNYEDWWKKSHRLSTLYSSAYEASNKTWNAFYEFKNSLRNELEQEIRRCKQKAEFFASRNTTKSSELNAQIQAYERILNFISLR